MRRSKVLKRICASKQAHAALMHVAQKHALGPDPRVRSGFGTTTCIKTRTESASHESL
ncbi:exported hypothetical protein [Mesorhizobium delmotii]|uniref:Transposase n=1 Tax=Mesorhizobium delmotii TaxID=1631247 RepID=A0A2P9AIY0_9HYPH|nr:exported hypothetical protein [Mesorhizobium delmotii]